MCDQLHLFLSKMNLLLSARLNDEQEARRPRSPATTTPDPRRLETEAVVVTPIMVMEVVVTQLMVMAAAMRL